MLRSDHDATRMRDSHQNQQTSSIVARPATPSETIRVKEGTVRRYHANRNEQSAAHWNVEEPHTAKVISTLSGQIEIVVGSTRLRSCCGQSIAVNGPCLIRPSPRTATAEAVVVAMPSNQLSAPACALFGNAPFHRIGSPFAECLQVLAKSLSLASPEEALTLYDATRGALLAEGKCTDRRYRQVATRNLPPQILQRIQDHIVANLNDTDLRPRTVATRFGISPRYLHKLFSTQGETFGNFVQAKRMEVVIKDLTAGALSRVPISEIAHRWGFRDISSFNRTFKARYHCSPSQYRNSSACVV
jgi:AraC-like DNA-binding protein